MLPAVKAFVSTDLGEYCWLLLGMATQPKRSFFHLTWFLCVRDVDSLLWPNQAAMNIQHPTIFFKPVGKKEARTLSFPDASTDCWTIGFCYSSGPQWLNVLPTLQITTNSSRFSHSAILIYSGVEQLGRSELSFGMVMERYASSTSSDQFPCDGPPK